ncbi:MAG: NAD(P)-binding domain-containing protein [Pseudomonadota bacterium]
MTAPCPIGLIGTGQIGSRMGRRLIEAGHKVCIHDCDPAAVQGVVGASIKASAAEVAELCDIIITCVTDSHAVRDVIVGDNGILEKVRADHLVIETTTSTPETSRTMANALRTRGAELIDAPVSRGVPAAENGTLSIMVGGEANARERAQPILSLLGSDIIATGDVGTGHVCKAMNMMVMAVNFVATMELALLGESIGIPMDESIARFREGRGRSFVVDHHWPRYILPETYDSGFTLGLMWKDLRIAREVVDECGQTALLGERAEAFYRWAVKKGLSQSDNTQLVEFVRSLKGSPVAQHEDAVGNRQEFLEFLDIGLGAVLHLGAIEALIVAQAAGVEPKRLLEVLNVSSGGSIVTRGYPNEHFSTAQAREVFLPIVGTAMREGNSLFLSSLPAHLLALAQRDCGSEAGEVRLQAFLEKQMSGSLGSA